MHIEVNQLHPMVVNAHRLQSFHSYFIALGGTLQSRTIAIMRQIAASLEARGCTVEAASWLYLTEPVGGGRQPPFLNAVLQVRVALPPARFLAWAKTLERSAGRRRGRRNGPRPIDIDILDCGGRRIGRATPRDRTTLVLPHPELHRRRFVLQPLLDIAPHWRHPRLDRSVRQLLARLPARPGAVQRILDPDWISCDEERLRSALGLVLNKPAGLIHARMRIAPRPAWIVD